MAICSQTARLGRRPESGRKRSLGEATLWVLALEASSEKSGLEPIKEVTAAVFLTLADTGVACADVVLLREVKNQAPPRHAGRRPVRTV